MTDIDFEVRIHSYDKSTRSRIRETAMVLIDRVLEDLGIFGYNIEWGIPEESPPFARIQGTIHTNSKVDFEEEFREFKIPNGIAYVRLTKI